MSTKLETAKDMATAVNGLIEITSSVHNRCVQELDQDYGTYQVIALLRLTRKELETLIDYLEVSR